MIGKILTGLQSNADATLIVPRAGKNGDTIVSELHGRKYEQTLRGYRFGVSNQAAVATTAGLATTFTGLAVANPAGSGRNLVIERFSYANTVAVPTACAIGLMTGAGAAAGALVPRNRLTGTASPATVATASAGATIATPVLEQIFSTHGTIATTGQGNGAPMVVDLEGSLIIPPGFFVASFTSAATTAAFIFSLEWEEVPIL